MEDNVEQTAAWDEIRPAIAADIREVLSRFVTEDGSVSGPGSVWVVSGRKPG